MTAPAIQIRSRDTDRRHWDDRGRQGDVAFRTLVDADGGPSSGLVQGLAEFAPGDHEGLHRHDRPETAFVLDGGGVLVLRGEEKPVEPGDMLFLPAGLVHGWRAGEEGMRVLYSFPADRFSEVAYHWDSE
jgi:quercetin dioxygenase-like cupin family protein